MDGSWTQVNYLPCMESAPESLTRLKWLLSKPSEGVGIYAEPEGVWLRGPHGEVVFDASPKSKPQTRIGRLLPTLLPQLLEMGLAMEDVDGFRISYSDFVNMKEVHSIDAFDGLVPWSHWVIQLETTGALGTNAFRYFYRFYAGQQIVYPERLGCFQRREGNVYQLDRQTYALIDAIDAYNALPPDKKLGSEAFIRFAEVKGLAEEVGSELDQFLLREKVVIPSEIALDIVPEEGGLISFAPNIDGVSSDLMRHAFFAFDDPEEVYSLDHPEGRLRVVLNSAQREVLRRMQRVRHLGGLEKAHVLRDPSRVFDGVSESVRFGPRVRGVGDFPFVARPYLQRSATGIFEVETSTEKPEWGRFSAGLRCNYSDGSTEDVQFSSRHELQSFRQAVAAAQEGGSEVINFKKKSIVVDRQLVNGIDELLARLTPRPSIVPKNSDTPRRYLLIYTNDNKLEYEEPTTEAAPQPPPDLPISLDQSMLKEHQFEGLRWLQHNYRVAGHRGCLLADDMGLGKTLQVLSFLAWVIERGDISSEGSPNPEAAPWNPILIVVPLALLENETWVGDMKKFFAKDGAIFQPWLSLHGSKLKELRHQQGAETVLGGPVLELNQLRQFRIVITNYETVVSYQHSFAAMNWSVVVTDEAQEYKTPNTKISHALKSLAPRFRVACTGTPVETRLLDVWNIFDYLQPGHLSSAENFRRDFEQPLLETENDHSRQVLPLLKERLLFGKNNSFVLRREKSTLADLPRKHEHLIECNLSPKQREWHLDLVGRARTGAPNSHPFSLIAQLMKVYQHPALLPRYEPLSPEELIKGCPKLKAVLDCLTGIKYRGEKVLIFTRSLNMQQVLASVIAEKFKIRVEIVNGATSRKGDTEHSLRTRKDIIREFRESKGFGVIILSPDVAGIGLTLIEANHVIHYGRWWNPAKESQATDRAYRIGQTRDVHVYYPIARDPLGAFKTFDENLDTLISKRKQLAADFLAPMPSEDQLQQELLQDVLGEEGTSDGTQPVTNDYVNNLPWDRFEALIALLEEKRGGAVLLTPCAKDDKADVIAIRGRALRLIQCKHTSISANIDGETLAEVCNALDIYRGRYLRDAIQQYVFHGIVATNGKFTRQAKSLASERDIELVAALELGAMLKDTPCTPGEIEAMESRRLASMRDVQAAITRLRSGA